MCLRIEWRSRLGIDGDPSSDALLVVPEDGEGVMQAWPVEPSLLADFLNDMGRFRIDDCRMMRKESGAARSWGQLVIARSESGEVLSVDPELYWNGIAYWFRSRGADPHRWRDRADRRGPGKNPA